MLGFFVTENDPRQEHFGGWKLENSTKQQRAA
jgi:hypothetical protein